ncbi:oligosaccharide flippase family protein [Myroides marinus]|uniref:oligosaccharide flippase family protein n=1 Tax=Myroides marinus TaxID=703342 RepID=UPI00257605A5|nr:oligosaccharide flippase family protein [Myroides marinus]
MIFSKKDSKVLLENFLSLSALQLIGMLLPLITLPYVLRVVGFEKYGIVVFAASLIAYFQSLTDFSFKITAVRDVATSRNNIKELSFIYSKVLVIKFFFLLLSLFIIAIIVCSFNGFYEYKEIYFYSTLLLIGYALFPEWFFQGIEQMKYITYFNIGVKLFFTICVFLFIKKEDDYWIYPLLQGVGFILSGIIGQLFLVYKYKLKFEILPFKVLCNVIKMNFPLFVNQFVPTLYNNTSVFVLGIFGAKTLVGIYQAILTVVNLLIVIIEVISRVFFPFLNRQHNAFYNFRKIMFSVYFLVGTLFVISHKAIFWYLNINYDDAFLVLSILIVGVFGYMLDDIYGLNYFIIKKKDVLVMVNTIVFSIVGMIVSYPLINRYGIIGCAITLSVTRIMMGGRLYYKFLMEKRYS